MSGSSANFSPGLGAGSEVNPIVDEVLRSPGQRLDSDTRAFFEPKFRRDFSDVRVHSDARAVESARSVNALAYTVGSNVVLGRQQFPFQSGAGRHLLAHELAHVVQQKGAVSSRGQLSSEPGSATHEQEATDASKAIAGGARRVPPLSSARAHVMRLTPQEFQKQLEQTPDEKKAIDVLFADSTFFGLWNYMKSCPATPKRDLGPLALDVQPGLIMEGKERFGGYFGGSTPTLKINPTKAEHQANPAELVDTIVHELIHAVFDLQGKCKAAGAGDAPLAGAGTATLPKRADVKGTPRDDKFLKEQGPGASNPCEEFIDINAAAQDMVTQIIKADIQASGVGRPTVTFVNEVIRSNPQAMTTYKTCRDAACAVTKAADRDNAIAACTADILNRFVPSPQKPAQQSPSPGVKAPEPERPKFGPLFKPRRDFNDKLRESVDNL